MPEEISILQRCSYIIPKKNRSCKMITKSGHLYCGEHAIFDPENQDRIPCPNDSKHTVLRQELDEHLTRCNSRLGDKPWIHENFNIEYMPNTVKINRNFEPNDEILERVADIVAREYEKVKNLVETRILVTEMIENYIENEGRDLGTDKIKHLKQISSIIAHLLQHPLIAHNSKNSCVIELGSGKAKLCYWMSKILPECKFLLVDRSGTRNKRENLAKQENPELEITRLRCSIEHLDLSRLELLQNCDHIVAVCKHLCGSATDFGLRCITNGLKNGLNIDGIVLTPCCHHRCVYAQYVGKNYLKSIGIADEPMFEVLRHISTWATCGFQKAANPCEDPNKEEIAIINWSIPEKETLGRKAKILLEMGRIKFLNALGFDVKLYKYTEFSLENLLIYGNLNK